MSDLFLFCFVVVVFLSLTVHCATSIANSSQMVRTSDQFLYWSYSTQICMKYMHVAACMKYMHVAACMKYMHVAACMKYMHVAACMKYMHVAALKYMHVAACIMFLL